MLFFQLTGSDLTVHSSACFASLTKASDGQMLRNERNTLQCGNNLILSSRETDAQHYVVYRRLEIFAV